LAGGEMGLYSLNRAFDKDRLTEILQKGFFRDSAALAVIFIADEEDVCFGVPAGKPSVSTQDPDEAVQRKRDCKRTAPELKIGTQLLWPQHEETVSPQVVLDKLRMLQGDLPVSINGIVHNNLKTTPKGTNDEFSYGYV